MLNRDEPKLNLYVNGHKIAEPSVLSQGVSGYLWGGIKTVPVTVYEEENWGKFLLASEEEELLNPRLYDVVSHGDNEKLREMLLPKEFYHMVDRQDREDDDWRIGDLMGDMFTDAANDDDTETEEPEVYVPFATSEDDRKRFASISEERQSEIMASMICEIGKRQNLGEKSAFVIFGNSLEADFAQMCWGSRAKRCGILTVEFFVERDDDELPHLKETTSLAVVPKKTSTASSGHEFNYSKHYTQYEPDPFPEIIPAEEGEKVPCHKTFLSSGKT